MSLQIAETVKMLLKWGFSSLSALSVAIAVSFTYNPLFSKVIEQMTDVHCKVRPVTLLFPSVEIAYL